MTDEPVVEAPSFEDFKAAIPETTREAFEKNGVNDFEALDKHYTNMNSLIGKKGLIRPDESAGEDALKAYTSGLYKELGVPENGEYEFNIPESWDENSGITQGLMDSLAKLGVETGISGKAYQGIVDVLGDTVAQMQNQSAELFGTAEALKEAWGDKFDANDKKVEAFIDRIAPDKKGLLNLPAFKQFALSMIEKTGEETLQGGNVTESGKAALEDELAKLNKELLEARKSNDYKELDRIGERRRAIFERLA